MCAHAVAGRKLLDVPADAVALVAVAVACQLAVTAAPIGSSRVLVPLSFALGAMALCRVLWTSSHDRLLTTIGGIGAVLNLLPIAVYGAMPVVAASRAMVESAPIVEPTLVAAKHVEVDSVAFPIGLAADWLPVPGLDAVASPGDVLLLVALVMLAIRRRTASDDDQVVQGVAQSPLLERTTNR